MTGLFRLFVFPVLVANSLPIPTGCSCARPHFYIAMNSEIKFSRPGSFSVRTVFIYSVFPRCPHMSTPCSSPSSKCAAAARHHPVKTFSRELESCSGNLSRSCHAPLLSQNNLALTLRANGHRDLIFTGGIESRRSHLEEVSMSSNTESQAAGMAVVFGALVFAVIGWKVSRALAAC